MHTFLNKFWHIFVQNDGGCLKNLFKWMKIDVPISKFEVKTTLFFNIELSSSYALRKGGFGCHSCIYPFNSVKKYIKHTRKKSIENTQKVGQQKYHFLIL